jgi:hypothetical protein
MTKRTIAILLGCLLLSTLSLAQGNKKGIPEEGKYDGKYRRGMRHGKGTCIWPDGSKYDGIWKYDTMNGKGIFTFKGYKYDGYWEAGKKNGRGTLTFPDGSYYTGMFKDDEYHGFGILKLADGSSHEGSFKNGKSDGFGKHTWASGTQYSGEWKNDQMHGKGILIYFDGNVEQGTFKNNEYLPCECKEEEKEKTPLQAYEAANLVFIGKVTQVYANENGFDEVFFEIEQYWKGEFGFDRTVVLMAGYTSCDIIFYKDESYLVYATSTNSTTGYSFNYAEKCTRTKDILFATYDIEELEANIACKQDIKKSALLGSYTTDFVCGCDGETYRNPYEAAEAGVVNWKAGKCNSEEGK